MHILLGLLILAAGAGITVKSEGMLNAFGRINFFERYLGVEGGSRLGYKLIGLLVAFIGILIFTDLMSGFLGWMLSPLIRASTPR